MPSHCNPVLFTRYTLRIRILGVCISKGRLMFADLAGYYLFSFLRKLLIWPRPCTAKTPL